MSHTIGMKNARYCSFKGPSLTTLSTNTTVLSLEEHLRWLVKEYIKFQGDEYSTFLGHPAYGAACLRIAADLKVCIHILTYAYTIMRIYYHVHILMYTYSLIYIYCHIHILSYTYTVIYIYYYMHILSYTYTIVYIYCHIHILLYAYTIVYTCICYIVWSHAIHGSDTQGDDGTG